MSTRLTPLAAALALAFVAPLPALAQTSGTTTTAATAADDGRALPTVTVNASADASAEGLPAPYAGGQVARGGRIGILGNKDVMDTPFSVTSYTQQFIKDSQARSVGDVLQNNPSVQVTRGYGNFQEAYMIRGFIADSDTLAYNGLYSILPRQYTASELVERVEVFLGASAFVNGAPPGSAGGLGGTINLVPKRATNEAITQATIGVETGGQAYYAADIGRRFGPEDRVGIRVNAARRQGGTGIDNESRELNLFSLGLDYRGNNFRLSADLGYQEYNLTQARPSVTLATGVLTPTAPSGSSNFAQPGTYSNERDVFGTIRGELDLTSDVTAWAAYGTRYGTERNQLASATLNDNAGSLGMSRFDNARRDVVRTGEVGLRAKLKTGAVNHTVTASASGYWNDSRNAYAMRFFAPATASNLYSPVLTPVTSMTTDFAGGSLDNPKTTIKTILSSVALADTLSFADDRVQLTLGARHQTLRSQSYDYNTQVGDPDYSKSALTPALGIVVKPLQNLSLYANYVEGLQAGKLITDTSAVNFGTTLEPYKTRQKEIGAKFDAGKVMYGLALFTTDKPLAYLDSVTKIESTNGVQRNRGIELTAVGEAARGVRILTGLTLLESKQRDTDGGTTNGNDAIGVPRSRLTLGGEWDIPGVPGLTLDGRITRVSTQYVDAANTQKLPAWQRYDMGVRYIADIGGRTITLRGAVQNLTNKNYWESAGGASNSGYIVLAAPRTFVTSVSVDF
ncbi:TonB-dependent receptor [Herbaspirillum sp. alder98]|uniref:TonB-dependent receptor n=1 Tax=Herbaspirillum sp. alder98 TaxID=2913096 RepID=UPI001CD85B99|nr:TonB-dependent siderophore receptor [Herbaspirillum sp. alder98]MCA1326553.1 TonB-dependent siderophore receptor [Herbaspirillum sp. alder98]